VTERRPDDEFEKILGNIGNYDIQNSQTIILDDLGLSQTKRSDPIYISRINDYVWKFPIDKNKHRVFIVMTMDNDETNTVIGNVSPSDIVVVLLTCTIT